jgi:hypothetical protein
VAQWQMDDKINENLKDPGFAFRVTKSVFFKSPTMLPKPFFVKIVLSKQF